jgi:hypothetical protein
LLQPSLLSACLLLPSCNCLHLQITVAEALLTLLQFVLLLVIGWAVDVKVWTRFMRGSVANSAASDAVVVSWGW